MTDPWDDAPSIDTGSDSGSDPWDSATVVEENDVTSSVLPFANKAIAETIGAPVDLIQSGLNLIPGVDLKGSFGGSDTAKRVMSSFGIKLPEEGQEPQTIPEHIGRAVGETSALLIPSTAAIKTASTGGRVVNSIANNIYQTMVKHPYLTGVSELTGAIGAGTGRGVGKEQFPENQLLQTTAEVAGGVAGGLIPTAASYTPVILGLRQGKNILKRLSLPFTKQGSKFRAGKFIKGQVKDPAATIEKISEETIGNLPPAIAAGEKKLTTLYKSLIGQDPLTDSDAIETLSDSIVTLEKEMRKMGYGSDDLLAEITEKRIASLELNMDRRTMEATRKAKKKIDSLPVAQRQSNESRIVRNEIEKVKVSEKKKVDALWGKVNKKLEVGVDNLKSTYQEITADLPKAQSGDIPAALKKSFILKTGKKEVTATNINEMQGLRSKLLENERIARKNGQWNRARIANKSAEAILEDIGIASTKDITPDAKTLQTALAGTRQFKNRFESGTIGKIFGISKTGTPSIDPSLTLDISIGRSGARGALDIDNVAITPEAIDATKRYMARSFTDFATDSAGVVKPSKAKDWIKNNEDILDKFPDFKKQISDINQSQKLAENTKLRMDARKKKLRDPKISTSAKFLNSADMNTTVKSIINSKKPISTAKELVKQANADPSGDALQGLRGSFVEHMLEKSSIGAFNEVGEQTLSGGTLLSFINKNKGALAQVFDTEQISRMKKIGKELAKIESFEKTGSGKAEIEMKDFASSMLKLVSRVGGAQFGKWVAGMTGGGTVQTPGIFSGKFQRLSKSWSKDKAMQLIQDAVTSKDKGLLTSLLLPIDKPTTKTGQKNLSTAINRMNIWIAGEGKRVLEDIDSEEITQEK